MSLDNLFDKHLGDFEYFNQSSVAEIKQAILTDLLDILGQDEVPTIPINDYHWRIRNELRQELREKIKAYCE